MIESVYDLCKSNKSNGIIFEENSLNRIDSETEDLLREVYEVFGEYSAYGLRNMVLDETPWQATSQNKIIDPKLIRKYFVEHFIE